MTHTLPSRLYRETAIQGHRMQCYAAARVWGWMVANHARATIERHRDRLITALRRMEGNELTS